jgi:tetratricopeptide (TPR) repeat protein
MGKFQEAIASCQQALAIDLTFANPHSHIAAALIGLHRYDEAILSCQKTISLNTNYPKAHKNLGVALWKLGRLEEAGQSFYRSIQVDPKDKTLYGSLIDFLSASGRVREGLIFLEQVAKSHPRCSALSEAIIRLKGMNIYK